MEERISRITEEVEEAVAAANKESDEIIARLKTKVKGLEAELAAARKSPEVCRLQLFLASQRDPTKILCSQGGSPAAADGDELAALKEKVSSLQRQLEDKTAEAEYETERIKRFPDELEEARTEAAAAVKKQSDAVITQLKVQVRALEMDLEEATKKSSGAEPVKGDAGQKADHSECEAKIKRLEDQLEEKKSESDYQDVLALSLLPMFLRLYSHNDSPG
jgi:hypothetical protein